MSQLVRVCGLTGVPVPLSFSVDRPRGRSRSVSTNPPARLWDREDGDGDLDLIVHVETAQLALTRADTEAVLIGRTIDGVAIEGHDAVRIVARKAGQAK